MTTKRYILLLAVTHLIAVLVGARLMDRLHAQQVSTDTDPSPGLAEIIAVDTGECTATVSVRVLNQRTGPGESYEITGSARSREIFSVQGWDSSRQWIRVAAAEGSAWMSARYVTLNGACQELPADNILAAAGTAPETYSASVPPTPVPTFAPATAPAAVAAGTDSLSAVFTPEVQFWAEEITAWASAYQLDPDLIATVIQIESCGNPSISSSAGAQGLFQVMPFHFAQGEDMLDVQTNARRGLEYLKTALTLAGGNAGLALAGYNGGHGVITRSYSSWPLETQRYYTWGSGIFTEAASGVSPTLAQWLAAGGSALCARASENQRTAWDTGSS